MHPQVNAWCSYFGSTRESCELCAYCGTRFFHRTFLFGAKALGSTSIYSGSNKVTLRTGWRDTGHGNPGWYSPARSTATDLTRTVGDPPIQPIGTWRLIGCWNHFTLQEISWLEGRRRSHVHAVACAAIDSWRASLPGAGLAHSTEPGHGEPPRRKPGSIRRVHASADASAPHQHRQPSCDAPARTTHTPRHSSASLDGQFPPLPSLGMPGLDVRCECSEAPQLPIAPVGPDTGSLLAEITALRTFDPWSRKERCQVG